MQNRWKIMKSSEHRPTILQGTLWRRSGAAWGAQGVPEENLGAKSWFVGPPLDPLMGFMFGVFVDVETICFCIDFWKQFEVMLVPFSSPT